MAVHTGYSIHECHRWLPSGERNDISWVRRFVANITQSNVIISELAGRKHTKCLSDLEASSWADRRCDTLFRRVTPAQRTKVGKGMSIFAIRSKN